MRKLTSCLVGLRFWLVLLTDHEVLHLFEHAPLLPGYRTVVPVLRILFSKLSMLPSFRPLSGKSLSGYI